MEVTLTETTAVGMRIYAERQGYKTEDGEPDVEKAVQQLVELTSNGLIKEEYKKSQQEKTVVEMAEEIS